jgi:hypothetical protein
MHKPTTRQGFQCFIVAIPYSVYVLNHYAWSHALRLVAQDQIRAGDRLVLCRKPVPAALSRFVPARFLVTLVSSCDVDRDLAPALAVSDKDTDDHCVKNGAAGTEAKRENNNKDKENNNGDGDGDGDGDHDDGDHDDGDHGDGDHDDGDHDDDDEDEDKLLSRVMHASPFATAASTHPRTTPGDRVWNRDRDGVGGVVGRPTIAGKKRAWSRRTTATPGAEQHPGDFELNELNQPTPHAAYVCDECGTCGHHFRVDCPRYKDRYDDTGTLVGVGTSKPTRVSLAHGIPRAFLIPHAVTPPPPTATSAPPVPVRSTFVSVPPLISSATGSTAAPVRCRLKTRGGELVIDARVQMSSSVAGGTGNAGGVASTAATPVVPATATSRRGAAAPPRTATGTGEATAVPELYFDFEDFLARADDAEDARKQRFYGANPAARRKLQSMCTHWLRGLCQKDLACEYLHRYNTDAMPICKFFLHGTCVNAEECAYKHTLPPSAGRAFPCLDYALGFCARGGGGGVRGTGNARGGGGGGACPFQHLKREAPSRADFEGQDALFEALLRTWHGPTPGRTAGGGGAARS